MNITPNSLPRKRLQWFAIVGCLLVAGLLHLELAVNNVRNGPGVYDDASFAVVSKNLADGRGYLLTLDYGNLDHRGSLFSPKLGTGPSVILPGAAAIALFGNEPAVPGMSLLLLNALALGLWAAVMGQVVGAGRVAAYVVVFLTTAVSFTVLHHEHWYAFLGEYQAFLLAALAFAIASLLPPRAITQLIAGALLGLAVLSKELSALSVVAFGAAFISQAAIELALKRTTVQNIVPRLRLLCLSAGGALAPILAFEAYRLVSLGGISQWRTNWAEHLAFVREQGFVEDVSLLQRLTDLNQQWGERFLHSALLTTSIVVAGAFLVWRYCDDRRIRLFCWLLLWAFAVHAGYWLLMSNGWPRYAFNAVLFAAAIPPVLLLGAKGKKNIVLSCVVAILIIASGWQGLRSYVEGPLRDAFRAPQGATLAQAQLAVSDFVDRVPRSTGQVVYAPWWAHVAAIEYLSREPGKFAAVTDESTAAGWVVIDTRLPLPSDQNYKRLAARCTEEKEFPPVYRILRCKRPDEPSRPTELGAEPI